MSVLLVLTEFLKQNKETRKAEEIKPEQFNKNLCVLNEKMERISSH